MTFHYQCIAVMFLSRIVSSRFMWTDNSHRPTFPHSFTLWLKDNCFINPSASLEGLSSSFSNAFMDHELDCIFYVNHISVVSHYYFFCLPSVLWCCWLGVRNGIQPVKIWLMRCWHGYLLERSANSLHMVQLMPLPLHYVCFSKIQNGLSFW